MNKISSLLCATSPANGQTGDSGDLPYVPNAADDTAANSLSAPETDLATQRRKSKEIDKQLNEWHQKEKGTMKMLLLGTGESGKTTFTKQMKIIHMENGITEEEKVAMISSIRMNLKESIQSILGAMVSLNIPVRDPDNQARMQYILTAVSEPGFDFPPEFYDHVQALWYDPGVQECYRRSNEFQLIDSAKYFLERVDAIRKPDYVPTDQDILRTRVVTTNIQMIRFSVKKVNFHLYDAGGQQGERRKWIQVFQNANAIIFVADCSSFDTNLREDKSKNRLIEAVEIFEQVWNNRFLRNVDIFLFLNKIDLLEEKISKGRSFDNFVDQLDESDPYFHFFKTWYDWNGASDEEAKEFMDSYPSSSNREGCRRLSEDITPQKRRPSTRKGSIIQMLDEKNIHQKTVRTAVFLKRMFIHILSHPMGKQDPKESVRAAHSFHSCQVFYTCAVDTDTVKKVFNACKAALTGKRIALI